MRLGQHPLGLLLNFDVPVLKEGIYRKALSHPPQAEPQSPADLRDGFDSLSAEVLHAALDVHRALGPGLMRSAYEECLCHELSLRCIPFQRPHRLPLRFDHRELGQMAEVPLVVCSAVPVICLSAAALTRLHEARLLARLRQGGWPHGFLLNFNAPTLKQGIRRLTLA
jgi:GxxExxY protein